MRLTDERIKEADPRDKSFKLFDGKGLYLLVAPAGGKWWRFKYHYLGKEKLLSLGIYPQVSLDEARTKCLAARALLADGVNPGEQHKMEKVARRLEEHRQAAATRFSLDNDGALFLRIQNRRLVLSPAETFELRTFLDATRAVKPKETPCP